MVSEKKVVVLCGGGSGCVTNIICDRLMEKSAEEYFLIVAGRTPMEPRNGVDVPFIKFDLFAENATDNLLESVETLLKNQPKDNKVPKKVTAVINSISTGGKISYDTTYIAFLNYVSMNAMIHLATKLSATLVHMSSMKVGEPESFDPKVLEGGAIWKGARSPYAWSKLAAELKLMNSDLKNMSFIRIGLMDSEWGRKFYTRVRAVCDFRVVVTAEQDLQDEIEKAIVKKGRHITTVDHHIESNLKFYTRMSGRWLLFRMPVFIFNFVFGNLMPTKMIDYINPANDTSYKLPL